MLLVFLIEVYMHSPLPLFHSPTIPPSLPPAIPPSSPDHTHPQLALGSTEVGKQVVQVTADMTVQDSMLENITFQHNMEKGALPMTCFLVVKVCVCVCVCVCVSYMYKYMPTLPDFHGKNLRKLQFLSVGTQCALARVQRRAG